MQRNWNVTYETVTQESAEYGDAAERGFLGQDLSFRDAFKLFQDERDWTAVEADCWRVSIDYPPRWLTDSGEIQFASGERRSVSLHMPDDISAYSAVRIARLVNCYGLTE